MTDDDALLQVAPELRSVPEERRAYFLEQARLLVDGRFGQFALANATAHLLTIAARGADGKGAAGPLLSEKEGELARSYADTSSSKTDSPEYWRSTNYGMTYWSIVRSLTFAARNRMV